MLDKIKDFIQEGNNLTTIIIIASFVGIFILLVVILLLLGLKKKKFRKQLGYIRSKIEELKQHEVIKNYTAYDNLKSDQKLGMLVLKWKKEIEKFIREVDAQFSMLDVLEDAINQGNYQYFVSLVVNIEKDIQELEEKANKYKEEIIEYVDMASDNRKYINKYHEMYQELKQEYITNCEVFKENKERIERFFNDLDKKFSKCYKFIDNSEFTEADNIASEIFKDIKVIENYLHKAPQIITRINDEIIPKLYQLSNFAEKFTINELLSLNVDFKKQLDRYTKEIKRILEELNSFEVSDFEGSLQEIEYYISNTITRLEKESKNKEYLVDSLTSHKTQLLKIENTAKNFISIFKIVIGSYNITNKEIEAMETLLDNVKIIKEKLNVLEHQLTQKDLSYNEMINEVKFIKNEISSISQELDGNLVIIDEIYKDEKAAREQINLMTEKINGTKKYIKYANLDNQDKYLNILKQLNQELAQLYVLLGTFPIDIVKLNNAVKVFVNRVENITQEINRVIYKTLLAEFVIVYANRYFKNTDYQEDLLIAEDLFYKRNYNSAYEKAMEVLEKINVKNKKIVLEKYQAQFNEIFS